MKAFRVLICGGLLCLLAASLYGQTYAVFNSQVEDVIRKTRFMLGPFRFHPVLKFAYFSWVSNIFGYTNTLENLSDFVISPSPELTASLVFRRSLILSFTENPEYHYYLTQSKYRGFNNSYRAEAKVLLFNRIMVTGGYTNQTQRLLGYLELDRIVQTSADGFRAQAYYETPRGTSVALEGRRDRLSYQDVLVSPGQGTSISSRLNHEETIGSAEFGYRLFSGTQFFLRGTYANYDFLNADSGWRTSHSAEIVAGIRLPGTRRTRGSLTLGYKKFMPVEGGTRGFSGIVGNANLEFRMENFGIFELGFNRDNYFSLLEDFLFYVENSVRGRLTFRTTRFLFLRLGGQYSLMSYAEQSVPGRIPELGSLGNEKDHFALLSAGFIVRISYTFGIGMTYQFWLRKSHVLNQDYNGYLFTIDIMRNF
jgi:hypothetical protein